MDRLFKPTPGRSGLHSPLVGMLINIEADDGSMRRRTVLTLLGAVAAGGCLESDGAARTDAQTTEVVTGTAGELTVSGSGSEQTTSVRLGSRLTIASYEHRPADGEFTAQLVERGNPDNAILLNVAGDSTGRTAFGLSEGVYRLDIEADGDWTVSVTQPETADIEASAEPLPTIQDGSGSDVRGPFELDGPTDVTAVYSGNDDFNVEMLDRGGRSVAPNLFDETGSFSGEATLDHRGYGWFDVTTTGDWSLDIEPQ